MIANGTLLSDGSVDEAVAAGHGWRLEQGEWVGGPAQVALPADGGGL